MKIISDNLMPIWQEQLDIGKAETPVPETPENLSLFSRCREALFMAARFCPVPGKRVMVPAYTCPTVYNPFRELGWEVAFYPITRGLRINTQAFREVLRAFRPSAVVAHPFYGADLNDEELSALAEAKRQGVFMIEDLTQLIFSTQHSDVFDAFVGSLRKWFPMADGGFLLSDVLPKRLDVGLPEDETYVKHMRLAGVTFRHFIETGDRGLNSAAKLLMHSGGKPYVEPHTMSAFSRRIYAACDQEKNAAQRMENCRYLYERLKDCKKCVRVWRDISDMTTAPLWFPLYFADTDYLVEVVAKEGGFTAPRMWGKEAPETFLDADVRFIVTHIACPSIGQNFTTDDMERIAVAIETSDMEEVR